MATRPNRKVVKYKKVLKITIEGQADTVFPDKPISAIETPLMMFNGLVKSLDQQFKGRSVSIEEIK